MKTGLTSTVGATAFELTVPDFNMILSLIGPTVELASTGLVWHCGIEHVRSGGARKILPQVMEQSLDGRRIIQMQFPDLTPAELRQAPRPEVSLAESAYGRLPKEAVIFASRLFPTLRQNDRSL